MSEVELREQIALILADVNSWDNYDAMEKNHFIVKTDRVLKLIKEAGYLPVEDAEVLRAEKAQKQVCIDDLKKQLKEMERTYEPVQLEVLGEKEIRYKLELIQPEGFNWADATETEMIKFKAISQANNTHNEAKGQLYRRIDGH